MKSENSNNNGSIQHLSWIFGIVGMTFGIVSLVIVYMLTIEVRLALIFGIIGLSCAVVGVATSIVGRKSGSKSKGKFFAEILTSMLALLICIFTIGLSIYATNLFANGATYAPFRDVQQDISPQVISADDLPQELLEGLELMMQE